MQRFERSKIPPSIFRDRKFSVAREELLEFFMLETRERSQTRVPGEKLELDLSQVGPIHDALGMMFRGKCAFCETQDLTIPYRFRTSSSAMSRMGDIDSHLYYVWLANAWENIYPICLACIPRQPSFFPVDGPRVPIPNIVQVEKYVQDDLGVWGDYPMRESSVLLDPCAERYLERHIFPSINGELLPLSDRADTTIANFRLDRTELNEARGATLRKYLHELLTVTKATPMSRYNHFGRLLDFTDLEFGGLWYLQCRRIALFLSRKVGMIFPTGRSQIGRTLKALHRRGAFSEERNELERWIFEADFGRFKPDTPPKDYGKLEERLEDEKTFVPLVYPSLQSLEIRHFKAIEELKLTVGMRSAESLLSKTTLQPALLILGENATGKSSILEAIALALSPRETRNGLNLKPASLVLNPAQLGSNDTPPESYAQVRLVFDEGRDRVLKIEEPVCKKIGPRVVLPVFAYGAFRQYQRKAPAVYEPAHTIVNLFETDRLLSNPEQWLLGLKDKDFNDVARALKIIISVDGDMKVIEKAPDGKSCLIVTAPAGVMTKTPLNDVSSGYRTILAMVCDIMHRLMDRTTNPHFQGLEHAQAVVLIDEVEAHLHPRWKIQIMHVLRTALPRVTFIATSHDPLCLRGMQKDEVVVVQRRSRAAGAKTQYAACIERLENLPDCAQLTIEQLLTSDFFNLMSTDQPETEKYLANVADLLSKQKKNVPLTPQEQNVMDVFEAEINKALPIGTSEAQRVVQAAVAEFLQERQSLPSNEWENIRAEAKKKILNILRDF